MERRRRNHYRTMIAPPAPLSRAFPSAPLEVTDLDVLDPADYPGFAGKPLREAWNSYRYPLRDMSAHIVPSELSWPVAKAIFVLGDNTNNRLY